MRSLRDNIDKCPILPPQLYRCNILNTSKLHRLLIYAFDNNATKMALVIRLLVYFSCVTSIKDVNIITSICVKSYIVAYKIC